MSRTPLSRCLIPLGLAVSAGSLAATPDDTLAAAIAGGTGHFELRYRLEHVDQQGFDKDANASTARIRFGWESAPLGDFAFGFEADQVSVIGPEHYNSTDNGRTEYPVVADPEGFDLNQAYVRYRSDAATVTGGRQRILLGGQRFVGGVGWRQNEQTYDALRIEASPIEGVAVDYGYVGNVNRIFGPQDGAQPADWQGDTHLLTAHVTRLPGVQLDAYVYLMDFENDNGPVNSNATYGVDLATRVGPASLAASYARQADYADSPLDYDTYYAAARVSLPIDPVTLSAGYEVLGSDGGSAGFRTPLATLHKFQGWADQFLATPDTGIRDAYLGLASELGAFTVTAVYHDFSAEDGGADYGDEIDLAVAYTITPRTSVELKYADYSAEDFATDTMKAWLTFTLEL